MKTENRSQKTIMLSSLHFLNFESPASLPVIILVHSPHKYADSGSIGKHVSAFGASSFKHLSAIGCCHSLSEAVLHLALSLFRLVCSKHIAAPPFVLYPVNLSYIYPAGILMSRTGRGFISTVLFFCTVSYIIHIKYAVCQEIFDKFFVILTYTNR